MIGIGTGACRPRHVLYGDILLECEQTVKQIVKNKKIEVGDFTIGLVS